MRGMSRSYCPGCEPTADPIGEVLDVRWCDVHAPGRDGLEDGRAHFETAHASGTEAGGEDNRRWCELVHRRVS
jgi:hypothetical protein